MGWTPKLHEKFQEFVVRNQYHEHQCFSGISRWTFVLSFGLTICCEGRWKPTVCLFGCLSYLCRGLAGAEVLSKCASKINCDKLDISDTAPTDEGTHALYLSLTILGLALILDGLAANSTLTSLDISFNYEGTGAAQKVANALCNLAKSICPLEGRQSNF